LSFFHLQRIGFRAVVETDSAGDAALATVFDGFDAGEVEFAVQFEAFLRTGGDASAATFAIVFVDLNHGRLICVVYSKYYIKISGTADGVDGDTPPGFKSRFSEDLPLRGFGIIFDKSDFSRNLFLVGP
jgi:hypothetical protein